MKSGISILHFEDQHGDITPVVFEIYLILRAEALTCYGSGDFQMLTDKKSDDLTVFDLLDVRDHKVPPIRYIVTSRPRYDAEEFELPKLERCAKKHVHPKYHFSVCQLAFLNTWSIAFYLCRSYCLRSTCKNRSIRI